MRESPAAQAQTQEPSPGLVKANRPRVWPRYVRACHAKAWTLVLQKKTGPRNPSSRRLIYYTCRSWRHPGACQDWRSHFEFRRCEAAFARQPDFTTPAGEVVTPLVFFVLTFDQNLDATGRPTRKWRSKFEAFLELWRGAQSFRQALARRFKDAFAITAPRRARPATRKRKAQVPRESEPTHAAGFVSTVEAHRTGWPHLNLVISNRALAAALADDPAHAAAEKKGNLALQAYYRGETKGIPREVKASAMRCGFGLAFYVAPVRNRSEMAAYITKNAKQIGSQRAVGEIVKLSQIPEEAPPRFRRIRSSIRFLDQPHSSDEWTGQIEKRALEDVAKGWDLAARRWPDEYGENAGEPVPGRLTDFLTLGDLFEPAAATLEPCTASPPDLLPFASCVARLPTPPRASRLEDPSRPRLAAIYRERVEWKLTHGPDLRRVRLPRPFAPVGDGDTS